MLGSRPTVGHAALDRRIGVRVPTPQPLFFYPSPVERIHLKEQAIESSFMFLAHLR